MMSVPDVEIPQSIVLAKDEIVSRVYGIVLRPGNTHDYELLVSGLLAVRETKKQIEAFFDPLLKAADTSKKAADAAKKSVVAAIEANTKALDDAEAYGKVQASIWMRESRTRAEAAEAIAFEAPKLKGIVHKEMWKAEVVDLVALAKYVSEHPKEAVLISANQTVLNERARSLKDSGIRIPGVDFVATDEVALSVK